MKHRHSNRILGRVANHRKQLLKNMSSSLLLYGRIITTEAKAKEMRRFFEPLVRAAQKTRTLTQRRGLLRSLAAADDVERLFALAEKNMTRRGGYMRLTRVPTQRKDAARMVQIDLIDAI